MTAYLLAALIAAFALITAAVARLVHRHSGCGPRHRLHRPDLHPGLPDLVVRKKRRR